MMCLLRAVHLIKYNLDGIVWCCITIIWWIYKEYQDIQYIKTCLLACEGTQEGQCKVLKGGHGHCRDIFWTAKNSNIIVPEETLKHHMSVNSSRFDHISLSCYLQKTANICKYNWSCSPYSLLIKAIWNRMLSSVDNNRTYFTVQVLCIFLAVFLN